MTSIGRLFEVPVSQARPPGPLSQRNMTRIGSFVRQHLTERSKSQFHDRKFLRQNFSTYPTSCAAIRRRSWIRCVCSTVWLESSPWSGDQGIPWEPLNKPLLVIPAKAGTQCLQGAAESLGPGFRRDDGLPRGSLTLSRPRTWEITMMLRVRGVAVKRRNPMLPQCLADSCSSMTWQTCRCISQGTARYSPGRMLPQ